MNSAQHQFRATADIRVPNISVFFFVLGALCLDLNLPRFEGIKTGNLAMIVPVSYTHLTLPTKA